MIKAINIYELVYHILDILKIKSAAILKLSDGAL